MPLVVQKSFFTKTLPELVTWRASTTPFPHAAFFVRVLSEENGRSKPRTPVSLAVFFVRVLPEETWRSTPLTGVKVAVCLVPQLGGQAKGLDVNELLVKSLSGIGLNRFTRIAIWTMPEPGIPTLLPTTVFL